MYSLKGKKALVTGSTQGIGLAIAREFINAGASVIVHCSNDLQKAKFIAKEIGAQNYCTYDLSGNDYEKLYKQTGDVDILVLNASVQYRTAWDEIKDAEFDKQVDVNFKSTLNLMQHYSKAMVEKKWGRILTIGSVQQYKPHKDMAVYAATKCAVMSIVRNIAKQLASSNVTVNNLSPGVIETPRNKSALSDDSYRTNIVQAIPMGRTGTAEECAGAALLLCSENGAYITGIDLIVDGGMSL